MRRWPSLCGITWWGWNHPRLQKQVLRCFRCFIKVVYVCSWSLWAESRPPITSHLTALRFTVLQRCVETFSVDDIIRHLQNSEDFLMSFINSAHLCLLQAHPYIFTKVNSQSRPEIPTTTSMTPAPTSSSTTSSASPPLWRSVLSPCLCGCPWLWALVAFWAALSFLWKFSTAIDVTNKSGQEVETKGMKFWFRQWFYSYNSVNLHLAEFSDLTISISTELTHFNLCKNAWILYKMSQSCQLNVRLVFLHGCSLYNVIALRPTRVQRHH